MQIKMNYQKFSYKYGGETMFVADKLKLDNGITL